MRQLEGEEKLDAMKQLDGNEAAGCRGETGAVKQLDGSGVVGRRDKLDTVEHLDAMRKFDGGGSWTQ